MALHIHPQVFGDLREIVNYYARVGPPSLVREFLSNLERAIERIEERPRSFSIRDRNFRRVNLDKFPYHVAFNVVGDEIRVFALRHHRRHPGYGTRRRWN